MMRTDDTELVRVSIRDADGLNTSVSLDGYLFSLLCQERGSEVVARAYVRARALEFVAAHRRGGGADGAGLPQSGLSRLVQRAVIQHLMMAAMTGKAIFSPAGIVSVGQ